MKRLKRIARCRGYAGLKFGDRHCFHVLESFWQTAQLVHFVVLVSTGRLRQMRSMQLASGMNS
jgi:hypothetical protein